MVIVCNKPYPKESNIKYESHFGVFSFPLSDFQKYAIEAIVEGHHALVACPTGSGKTLPAEFAINFFTSQGKKLIYTSPIKALSNQKYYEFTQKFPGISIGLMTGDIKVNPNADVLIMTTEILMNYLFNSLGGETPAASLQFQMDLTNELGCVVFDEVHYINDLHRGANWEQTILMLPRHVQMVMLSATIDSPERFAQWCERGDDSEKKVYLAYTNHRIVPLTHYGFLTNNESLFKGMKDKVLEKEIRSTTNTLIPLQTAQGAFQEANVTKIGKMLDIFKKKDVFMKRKSVLNKVTSFLKNNDMLPAIAFVFSRKNVESCAKEVDTILLEDDSKIPYTVQRECDQIIRRLPNGKEYLELPEYQTLVSLLEKGIGIHHSGMIPILREIVELFISKKYIKLLFATESFSIGLDCPIKTAVFTGIRKFDGLQDRFLMSHEYTQMAGRAGRRGIDTIGHVVHCNNLFKMPTTNEYKAILSGKPQELVSKFHISFQVMLNLMKQGTTRIDEMMDFVKKSMIQQEIVKETDKREKEMLALREKIGNKISVMNHLKTPREKMQSYQTVEEQWKQANGNKRKTFEKDMQNIKNQYVTFEKDYAIFKEWTGLNEEYSRVKRDFEYMEDFIHVQVETLLNILEQRDYIRDENQEKNDETRARTTCWKLTDLGVMASHINEIHGLVVASFLKKERFFENFSVLQIIGLLSCFTDIKVANEFVRDKPYVEGDAFLQEKIENVAEIFDDFYHVEKKGNIDSGTDYEKPLNFDIVEEVMEWCKIDNEIDCKYFIQNKLATKEISIGEFTKAILKISVIGKELETVCELRGEVTLQQKLSQIDGKILKYITVCQSLYV